MACANVAGEADSNGSQFFITLDRCDHLDRQNTIFGRVEGNSIFTVARLGELEVDASDRPVDPPRITTAEVLWPPFDDIVPRTTPAQRAAEAAAVEAARKAEDIRLRKQKGLLFRLHVDKFLHVPARRVKAFQCDILKLPVADKAQACVFLIGTCLS